MAITAQINVSASSSVLFLSFSVHSTWVFLFFSLLTSYLVSCRLAHHVWRDSARHSRLSLTRPAGYPLRQLKIWRPCRSPISPSALTGWTGFARACRWPARPARPSCGRQVRPLRKHLHCVLCPSMRDHTGPSATSENHFMYSRSANTRVSLVLNAQAYLVWQINVFSTKGRCNVLTWCGVNYMTSQETGYNRAFKIAL